MHMQTQGGNLSPHVVPALVIWRVDHESAGRPLGTHAFGNAVSGVGGVPGLGAWTSGNGVWAKLYFCPVW